MDSPGCYDALALVNAPLCHRSLARDRHLGGAQGGISGVRSPRGFLELDASGAPIPFEILQTSPIGTADVPAPSTLLLMSTEAALRSIPTHRTVDPMKREAQIAAIELYIAHCIRFAGGILLVTSSDTVHVVDVDPAHASEDAAAM